MGTGDPAALARDKAFLGREFLTWLWYRCEVDGGEFDLRDGPVAVLFNDYVSLVSQDGESKEESIVRRASAHRSPEARTALLSGKVVSLAKLEIARGDREWRATVVGESLDLRSVKTPPENDETREENKEARFVAKVEAYEELAAILDGLYGRFLDVRLAPEWEEREAPAMGEWIRARAAATARIAVAPSTH